MKIDILVAEIGSTTTVVNGFMTTGGVRFAGSGQWATTVLEGDVNVGLENAIENLRQNLGVDEITYDELLATSSAAGGLRMTVHGLVYDMTVRAAKEAALGAGANIHMVTAGRLRRTDISKLEAIKPNIILLAGGVDYGERDTALDNAEKIAELDLGVPVIYAGNIQNREEIELIFKDTSSKLYLVDNVYPSIDKLNVEPTRKVIQEVFEEHITKAPGMERVRSMVNGNIIPTPAGVMEATKLLGEHLGDVVTIDVGGATTDVHSVTRGSDEINRIMIAPEPEAKRTVEGDLGVYVNAANTLELAGREQLALELGMDRETFDVFVDNHKPIPITDLEKRYVEALTWAAAKTAIERHAGTLIDLFSTSGRKQMAQGKDLTAIQYIIGTGGALTRLPEREGILNRLLSLGGGLKLLPGTGTQVLIDNDYVMASLGVLSKKHPEESLALLKQSLRL